MDLRLVRQLYCRTRKFGVAVQLPPQHIGLFRQCLISQQWIVFAVEAALADPFLELGKSAGIVARGKLGLGPSVKAAWTTGGHALVEHFGHDVAADAISLFDASPRLASFVADAVVVDRLEEVIVEPFACGSDSPYLSLLCFPWWLLPGMSMTTTRMMTNTTAPTPPPMIHSMGSFLILSRPPPAGLPRLLPAALPPALPPAFAQLLPAVLPRLLPTVLPAGREALGRGGGTTSQKESPCRPDRNRRTATRRPRGRRRHSLREPKRATCNAGKSLVARPTRCGPTSCNHNAGRKSL